MSARMLAGWAALAGCFAAVAGNILGVILNERTGLIDATISDVAAGRYALAQDIGLFVLSAGMLALAAVFTAARSADTRTRWGAFALTLTAIAIGVIAGRNEYGDRDSSGVVIHIYVVYALGALFPATVVLLAPSLGRLRNGWRTGSYLLAAAWIIAAPVFLLVPDSWDGLYERGVALLLVGWVAVAGWLTAQDPRRGTG